MHVLEKGNAFNLECNDITVYSQQLSESDIGVIRVAVALATWHTGMAPTRQVSSHETQSTRSGQEYSYGETTRPSNLNII